MLRNKRKKKTKTGLVGWLFVLGLTTLWGSISVFIGLSPKRGRKGRERIDESKNVQTNSPATTASAEGPCPSVIQIVGHPGTESLPRTIAPPDHLTKTGVNVITSPEQPATVLFASSNNKNQLQTATSKQPATALFTAAYFNSQNQLQTDGETYNDNFKDVTDIS